MIDVQKVNATKERILTMIQTSGPSFPTRIARETGISPLFISALLAELVAERKIIMSNMKVGSSPLYFIKGQEPLLENFTQYLNSKEKEVVLHLKESSILNDEAQDPAMRVALRKTKDFAIPITARFDEEEKLFWKFFTLSDEEAHKKIKSQIITKEQKTLVEEDKTEEKEKLPEEAVKEDLQAKPEKKPRKTIEKKPSQFALMLKDYLIEKNIELVQDITSKAKEYHARVRMNTSLGQQDYFLIAKEKKKLTEDDLAIALHKAQAEKMPALLISTGNLDKDALVYLEQWKNLIKIEKLKH